MLCQESGHRDHGGGIDPPLISNWQLLVWLVFRCKKQRKQPGKVEGDLFAKGQSDNAAGPIRRFNEPGRMGTEPLLCQIQ